MRVCVCVRSFIRVWLGLGVPLLVGLSENQRKPLFFKCLFFFVRGATDTPIFVCVCVLFMHVFVHLYVCVCVCALPASQASELNSWRFATWLAKTRRLNRWEPDVSAWGVQEGGSICLGRFSGYGSNSTSRGPQVFSCWSPFARDPVWGYPILAPFAVWHAFVKPRSPWCGLKLRTAVPSSRGWRMPWPCCRR